MPEQPERFAITQTPAGPATYRDGNGHWVRYSDYEKALDQLRVERDQALTAASNQRDYRAAERQRVRETLGPNVHRVTEALETWLLDYADPDDGDWPERAEYVKAINDFRAALNTLEDPL